MKAFLNSVIDKAVAQKQSRYITADKPSMLDAYVRIWNNNLVEKRNCVMVIKETMLVIIYEGK